MATNLDKYKEDLTALIDLGGKLANSIQFKCYPKEFRSDCDKVLGEKSEAYIKTLPNFNSQYQIWYSEALAVI